MGGGKDMRSGISGEGNRPWVAVWLVLMERAMDGRGLPSGNEIGSKAAWLSSLGAFLLAFRRHPGKLTPREIRDYLFRTGEVGGSAPSRSLTTAMETLAFFYAEVVPRPHLAEAARRPFESRRDWKTAGDDSLLDLLREKRIGYGTSAYAFDPAGSRDWSAA